MEGIEHKTINANGINIHVAIKGPVGAPVILFIHGFPGLWYSWRHQISALSALGYRTVAPDLRGYGGTDAPNQISDYTCFHIVGDLIALIAEVAGDQEKVFVVGHDWGAIIAWCLCFFRPDKVKALVNLSVPLRWGDSSLKPTETIRNSYGVDHYIYRFQEPGGIEAEFGEIGTEKLMRKILTYRTPGPIILPKGKKFWGCPDDPIPLPSWLNEEEVQYFVSNFEKTGFTGPVNYYRNMDRNYKLMAPWADSRIQVPVKFAIGDIDLVYHMPGVKDYILGGAFKKDVPLLEEPVVMEGVGHFLNQEKPQEFNQLLLDFFSKF